METIGQQEQNFSPRTIEASDGITNQALSAKTTQEEAFARILINRLSH